MKHSKLYLDPPIESGDRLAFTMVVALAVHALIILGIRFLPPDPGKAVSNNQNIFEVTLVDTRSEKASKQANYLAQANQQGDGNTQERVRATTLMPSLIPKNTPELSNVLPAQAAEAQKQLERREVLTALDSDQRITTDLYPTKRNEAQKIDVQQLNQLSTQIASLQARLGAAYEVYSKESRHKRVAADAKEYKYASYIEAWQRRVEHLGTLYYPAEAKRRGLSGELDLEVVIKFDGTIAEVQVLRSSGQQILDDAAKRIVHKSAPFAAFPEDVRKEADFLHITRTWRFVNGGLVSN
ncbi:MAG: energy transducer TonB [Gammaproteobacteria bacterium]|nr:energy transducer TonB [Gammaproteobacteria bacterium]